MKALKLLCLFFASILVLSVLTPVVLARTIRTDDIKLPPDYKIEKVVDNLNSPSMVTWDDQGRMLIAEDGYDGSGEPRVERIEKDGSRNVLAHGLVFGKELPITSVGFYQGKVYVVHAGTVSIIEENNKLKNIIIGLPGQGDHQANTILFKDGKMYLSIGTVTNSAVVGPDNAVFGWLEKEENRSLHDIPCKDITLNENSVFESENALGAK